MTQNSHFTYCPIGILLPLYPPLSMPPHQGTVVEGTESREPAPATLELAMWLDVKILQDLDGFDRL